MSEISGALAIWAESSPPWKQKKPPPSAAYASTWVHPWLRGNIGGPVWGRFLSTYQTSIRASLDECPIDICTKASTPEWPHDRAAEDRITAGSGKAGGRWSVQNRITSPCGVRLALPRRLNPPQLHRYRRRLRRSRSTMVLHRAGPLTALTVTGFRGGSSSLIPTMPCAPRSRLGRRLHASNRWRHVLALGPTVGAWRTCRLASMCCSSITQGAQVPSARAPSSTSERGQRDATTAKMLRNPFADDKSRYCERRDPALGSWTAYLLCTRHIIARTRQRAKGVVAGGAQRALGATLPCWTRSRAQWGA